ncbi:hypothetical protein SynRS9907_02482 [Synechococcus sp. RS9907]|nr:hypothetical protein SynRS9907_02482 [Synechococcus sp. RS9907]
MAGIHPCFCSLRAIESDRAISLLGVSSLWRHIQAVIQSINRAGNQAEGSQRSSDTQPDVSIEPDGKQRRREHQQIFGPLPRTAGS